MRRPLRGASERDWRILDRLFAGVVVVVCLGDGLTSQSDHGSRTFLLVAVAAMALTLLWRRRRPLICVVAVAVGSIAVSFAWDPKWSFFSVTVLVIISMYSAGRHADRRESRIALAIGLAGVLTVCININPADILFPVGIFGLLPWIVGRLLRNQTELTRQLAERTERLEHARAEEERHAVARERTRIARELHDVLAHNLSVMVVQAGAARRIVDRDPERAAEAARLIQRTGREAMSELRLVFGPVRHGDGEELSGPPSLERLDELVTRARAAGLGVDVRIEGARRDVPPGVDLVACRIVQEALTNTLKHAGPARSVVRVTYEPWEVVVEVEDDGAGVDGALGDVGGGHGLVGMRERVGIYGGVLHAGSRPGGGFAVRARLPLIGPAEGSAKVPVP